jgi:hypothetical protein
VDLADNFHLSFFSNFIGMGLEILFNVNILPYKKFCGLVRVVKSFFGWKRLVVAGFKKWFCGKLCDLIIDFGQMFWDRGGRSPDQS